MFIIREHGQIQQDSLTKEIEVPGLFYGRIKQIDCQGKFVLTGYYVPHEQKISKMFKSVEEAKTFLKQLISQSRKHMYSIHVAI